MLLVFGFNHLSNFITSGYEIYATGEHLAIEIINGYKIHQFECHSNFKCDGKTEDFEFKTEGKGKMFYRLNYALRLEDVCEIVVAPRFLNLAPDRYGQLHDPVLCLRGRNSPNTPSTGSRFGPRDSLETGHYEQEKNALPINIF
jgi:hypothetical protein